VTNSRPQKRLLQIWRRRTCLQCGATFTTNEAINLATSIVMRHQNGVIAPFSRDKLFLSILRAVGHRKQPLEDADALAATVIGKLLRATTEAAIDSEQVVEIVLETLQHFDTSAAVQYKAYHS
jgi:transcriptional repressor NrdR